MYGDINSYYMDVCIRLTITAATVPTDVHFHSLSSWQSSAYKKSTRLSVQQD